MTKQMTKAEQERQAELMITLKEQFDRAMSWEGNARRNFVKDIMFDAGDSYNNYQWPTDIYAERVKMSQPCITINKTRQHNLQIINEALQNQARVVIKPVGNQATYQAAQALTGLVRHIEYKSRATQAYSVATGFQVRGGYGVIRVATTYQPNSFETDIVIRPVKNPLSVLFDPDAQEPDKSDGRFAFVFDDVDKTEFGKLYPQYADRVPGLSFGGSATDSWIGEDKVRIAEYFYVTKRERELVNTPGPGGKWLKRWYDEMDERAKEEVVDNPMSLARTVEFIEVNWALIVGDEVVEEKIFPGKYIPLVPVIGEETIINGVMDRKGHTRALVAPQQMYNYWASAAIEYGALQTKIPWVGPLRAFDGLENLWANANRTNLGYLPFNDMDDEGNPVAAPSKISPPEQSALYINGMEQTRNEMMMVSGQYAANMGAQGNERSGIAIQTRERQGDNATYHFISNQSAALRQVGEIILGLVPHVYTAPRIVQILGEDQKSYEVMVNPEAAQAYEERLGKDSEVAQRILNPMVGEYAVEADVGPGFATMRQEGANAIQQILTNAPNLTGIIGDLLLRNMDFPGADEAAERLNRLVPPQALGKGPSQKEQEQAALIKNLGEQNSSLMDAIRELTLKLQGKEQMRQIDTYKAETGRLDVVLKNGPKPPDTTEIAKQLVTDILQTDIDPVWQTATKTMLGQYGGQGQTVNLQGLMEGQAGPEGPQGE